MEIVLIVALICMAVVAIKIMSAIFKIVVPLFLIALAVVMIYLYLNGGISWDNAWDVYRNFKHS